jgi:hypothetical protein
MTLNDRYNLLNLEHEYWLAQWNAALDADDDSRAGYCEGMAMSVAGAIESIVTAMDIQDDDETNDGVSSGVLGRDSGHRPESQPA